MKPQIYIDGQHGTTGLEIHQLLGARDDLTILDMPHGERHSVAARRERLAAADIAILCLPDDGAREAARLAPAATRLLDASTAHRVDPGWTFGIPELCADQRSQIRTATRVSNPGCYATGYLLIVRALVDANIIRRDAALTCHALSGYSGGGRAMIADYQSAPRPHSWAARPYALQLDHKHVPEMHIHGGTAEAPIFCPIVCDYPRGMLVQVPLSAGQRTPTTGVKEVHAALALRYAHEPAILVQTEPGAYLSPEGANYTNSVELFVTGDTGRVLVTARLDNLGKGAAGAAVQNLNLMLGINEFDGVKLL